MGDTAEVHPADPDADGRAPTAPLFEVPIAGPLPEVVSF
jgi:hypothetical protein